MIRNFGKLIIFQLIVTMIDLCPQKRHRNIIEKTWYWIFEAGSFTVQPVADHTKGYH
jgi:hypothetical protein